VTELGAGAAAALTAPGIGTVVGVYSRAAYLRLPGGLMALTTLDVPSGPLHARAQVDLDRLRLHDRVVVTPSLLQAGPILVDLAGAEVWRGQLPSAAQLDTGQALAVGLLEGAPQSALDIDPGDLHDLATAAALLGGVGPGLTPAGDDCLAGILLLARIRGGEAAEAGLVAVAESVDTNEVAAAFLVWAARGQSIEPVHRFLTSSAEGRAADAADALAALVGFGHSSGADLALGLRLGLARVRSCTAVSPG
jgi:hypothetical protein